MTEEFILISAKDSRMIGRAHYLLRLIKRENLLAGLSPLSPEDKTQYKKALRRVRKLKGGKPPIDYTAVEIKIELEKALDDQPVNPALVAKYFYPLSRIIGF